MINSSSSDASDAWCSQNKKRKVGETCTIVVPSEELRVKQSHNGASFGLVHKSGERTWRPAAVQQHMQPQQQRTVDTAGVKGFEVHSRFRNCLFFGRNNLAAFLSFGGLSPLAMLSPGSACHECFVSS